MNISGGESCSTPFWQTMDLRLGVVTQRESAPAAGSRGVVLSCGTFVTAQCAANYDARSGAAVRVERRSGVWHIAGDLDNPAGTNR